MTYIEKALQVVKSKFDILEPVTDEQEYEKFLEKVERSKCNPISENPIPIDMEKSVAETYKRGNKLD